MNVSVYSVLTTLPNEVEAMVSLKRSLAIPERLGWESDPCTPSSWEGVTCITNPIGEGFVIYEIDLCRQRTQRIYQWNDYAIAKLEFPELEFQLSDW